MLVYARIGNLDVFFGGDVPSYPRKAYFEGATAANRGIVCSSLFRRHKTRIICLLPLDRICSTFKTPVAAKIATSSCDNKTVLISQSTHFMPQMLHTGKHFPGRE
jgi:hypothetical protein